MSLLVSRAQTPFTQIHTQNCIYSFPSASLLIISLLFLVTPPSGFKSSLLTELFFLAGWVPVFGLALDLLAVLLVWLVVFLGLEWDTLGFSGYRHKNETVCTSALNTKTSGSNTLSNNHILHV